MSYTPSDRGDTSSLIVYPVEHMRKVAAQVVVTASLAQSNHDTQWQQIQTYIYNNFDQSMQTTILTCLKPYADLVRASYDWQMSLATALFDAVDQIDSNEDATAQSFKPTRGPY
ncbi:MAG TPA: hypothetical protein VFV38_40545 [Ktedonobacteraceae bacterium]|nr:hypothetical protein [Ktedonobacteraceae bacterium]